MFGICPTRNPLATDGARRSNGIAIARLPAHAVFQIGSDAPLEAPKSRDKCGIIGLPTGMSGDLGSKSRHTAQDVRDQCNADSSRLIDLIRVNGVPEQPENRSRPHFVGDGLKAARSQSCSARPLQPAKRELVAAMAAFRRTADQVQQCADFAS